MGDIYFIYDGECPLCAYAASAFSIRQAVGTLHLINARLNQQSDLMAEIHRQNLNLDQGMVILYQEKFYHGPEALHLMALIGSPSDSFNKLNVFLFKSKFFARVLYPALRAVRNLLIKIKGVPKIDNLQKNNLNK
jgi:predicted DCC family thiol-disulfide oxidoreductase YuxK